MSHAPIPIVDLGAGQLVSKALAQGGCPSVVLGNEAGLISTEGTLIFLAFGHSPHMARSVADCDWSTDLHGPLDRCFSTIRHVGPKVREHQGLLVTVLPGEALLTRRGAGAQSVLYRSILGLMEGLRAELLPTQARVSIVFTDQQEPLDDLAQRLSATIAARSMYSLPSCFDVAAIRAVFEQMTEALAQTPSDARLPPAGPMGEVYREAVGG